MTDRKITPRRQKICSMCWQSKALTSYSVAQRGQKGGKCRKCEDFLRQHDTVTAARLRLRLKDAHSKKPKQEWVDFDVRDTLALEGLAVRMSDDRVKEITDVEDLLTKLVSTYGGVETMGEAIARDLFCDDVTPERRLRHHRLVLCIIACLSKVKAARAAERERVKLARAVNSSSVEDMPELNTADTAMRDAALPIVALAKHGMLADVVHWLIDNGHLERRDFGI